MLFDTLAKGMRKTIIAGNWKMNKTPSEAKALLDDRYSQPHASNLGGVLAKAVADEAGNPAFIYDAVTSSELPPETIPQACAFSQCA